MENSRLALTMSELCDILKSKDYQRVAPRTTGEIYTEAELDMLLDRSDLVIGAVKNEKFNVDSCNVFKVVSHDTVSDIQL